MIEVEKKFLLSEEDIERVTKDAEFLGEKKMTDSYFDTEDYALSSKDIWLRERNGWWELKVPLRTGEGWHDQYRELEAEEAIAKELGLHLDADLASALKDAGYVPFVTFTSVRRKFKRGDFIIDLDEVDFGYKIGEIELLVGEESEMPAAVEKISRFAGEMGLVLAPVRGKVIEFLKRNSEHHYQALINAGVVKAHY